MRAMVLQTYGLTPQLAEVPAPSPGANEVLVRVRATSVNPIDWKQASGVYRPILKAHFPFVPGYDLAGEVEVVGPGVQGFERGQRVHTRLSGQQGGANAELVCAGTDVLTPMPDGMDFAQAAGLPLVGLTALQALRDGAALPMQGATTRVLIVGASGGVGHLAVQLAHAAGAHVTGVCSAKNAALVRGLGADEVLDSANPAALAAASPFDTVVDCIGLSMGPFLARLRPAGRFVACVPGPAVFARAAFNRFSSKQVVPLLMKPNARDLALLGEAWRRRELRVVVDRTFPAAQLGDAWAHSRTGRTAGKLIVAWEA
jgi:NADPH:quinone reductase-like Zn-dependent oxidoreductase